MTQDHAAAHSAPDPTPLHPMPPSPNPSAQQAQALHRASGPSSADDPAGMPILAVTLGFEEEEQPAEATANSAAASVVPPTVSGAMRAEVMHLVWGNFEVGIKAMKLKSVGFVSWHASLVYPKYRLSSRAALQV